MSISANDVNEFGNFGPTQMTNHIKQKMELLFDKFDFVCRPNDVGYHN